MSNRKLMTVLLVVACLATISTTFAADAKPSGDKQIAVLKSASASRKDKGDACRELATIGDPKAIPVLVGLLGDEKLAHMARYALEPLADASVDVALRDAMGKLKGGLRIGVINSIGMRRDAKAVPDLTKLVKDADKSAASAAVGALGRIATPQAITALAGCRKAPPAELQWVIADASLDTAERLLKDGKSAGAIAIYTELSAKSWPRQVRLGAFSGLLVAESDKAPDRIAAALAGKDRITRAVAIARIATLKGDGVSARFAAKLPELQADVQVMLIDALAGRKDPSARPAIVKAAGHSDSAVRLAAIKALGSLGDTACAELLCDTIVGGKTDLEKQAAQSSLRALGAKGVDAVLIKRMGAAKGDLQIQLINILVDRKGAATTDALLAQAASKDAKVSSVSFRGLGRIASPKDLPAILKLLVKTKDDATRREAELAAVSVSRRIAKPAAQADDVLTALKTAPTTPAKRSLLAVLGGIGNDKAFTAVKGAVGDKTPEINDAAVRALTIWPNAKATDPLLAIFGATKDKTHRTLALRGIVRILSLNGQDAEETLAVYKKLLGGITQPADLKLVLSGLGTVADQGALELIAPFRSKKAVRREANAAYMNVAKAMKAKGKDLVYTKLIKAVYGGGSKVADVTAKMVKRKNKSGTIAISNKYNALFGDPAAGVPKVLIVTFELNGKKQTVTFTENTPFTLKLPAKKRK
ncbi:MAG: HEAT repeat domain-containing protein [Phycisphaerae bacterium]|jgi:HEAT repeat protein|nr:HEAT repeat domain-containing protein [Phycisphaerae bacterium]